MLDSRYDSLPNYKIYRQLPKTEQEFLAARSREIRFSFQEMKQLLDMAADFQMWGKLSLSSVWPEMGEQLTDKQVRAYCLERVRQVWQEEKNRGADYVSHHPAVSVSNSKKIIEQSKETLGLGMCPVASKKTRCCNLYTLDMVEGCGFDCSYCSIRTFYAPGEVRFDTNFADKLKNLSLDPNRRYHIGTGQASDSLMLGNHGKMLEALLDFARTHPHVILEFKTKSDNISYLLQSDIPSNVVTTWSLNPEPIIQAEEHHTVSLKRRLDAADKIMQKGNLIGFHLHPIMYGENWKELYGGMVMQLLERFDPKKVCMVSMGALTFIKPVVKSLREAMQPSLVLQVPLEDASGKQSYPLELKEEMFSWMYEQFAPWHDEVFFYLCMEDVGLWQPVFGYEYADNDAFEDAMLEAYFEKVGKV